MLGLDVTCGVVVGTALIIPPLGSIREEEVVGDVTVIVTSPVEEVLGNMDVSEDGLVSGLDRLGMEYDGLTNVDKM